QSQPFAAEEHQPPAYYFLASLIGHALAGSPLREAAAKMALVFYGARGLSVLFGLTTVAATYLLACQVFGPRRLARIGATSIVAFNPSLLAMMGAVTNDSMATAAGAFLLLVTFKATQSHLSFKTLFGVGMLVGIAALTKENLLPMLFPLALSLTFMAWRKGRLRDLTITALAVGLPAIAVASWWYARNLNLYGDVLGWNANALMNPTIVRSQLPGLGSYFSIASSVAETFWLGFGSTLGVRAPWPIYFTLWAGCAVALFGVLRLLRTRRPSPWLQSGRAMGLALITMDLLLLLLADLSYHRAFAGAGAGRYFFPAAGAVAIMLTLGLISAMRTRRPWLLGSFCAPLVALSVLSPFVFLAPLRVSP
ncbi:MAG: glycosyltransferase family 39 protein, partial [Dehalococcoidia bacterium]|nr:glycosyltransferase family 39 protein [Dehalococcoidia bacterium]